MSEGVKKPSLDLMEEHQNQEKIQTNFVGLRIVFSDLGKLFSEPT
jgi:hypothetical protein